MDETNQYEKVSILIPTYNRASFVVRSIESALRQNYVNIEVIVGVNGCEDDTLERIGEIKSEKLTVIARNVTCPMYDNFNSLLDVASGKYILLLSDDDFLYESAIKNLIEAIEGEPQAEVAFGPSKLVYHSGGSKRPTFRRPRDNSLKELVSAYFAGDISIFPCATLYLKSALVESGKYNGTKYGMAADVAAWMLTANRNSVVAYAENFIADYMIHLNNETMTSSLQKWRDAFEGIEKVINSLVFHSESEREIMLADLALYRCHCIARSQSYAVANSKLTISNVKASYRVINCELKNVKLQHRFKVIVFWLFRIILKSIK